LPACHGLLLGGVGRLDEAKGFSDLLGGVAILAREHPDLALVLAGDGPLRSPLIERAEALGIADRVHFVGYRRDVREVYEALDIFVLPSLCEAMPKALIEAMAMGLPTVGAAVGGVPEVIVPGVTGFVIPPRAPRALAEALRPLLTSAPLRLRMGEAGRDRVECHFDAKETARRTIEVYREMLQVASSAAVQAGIVR
jgi:glycosyltransferase involved in cell wall biosynthesis